MGWHTLHLINNIYLYSLSLIVYLSAPSTCVGVSVSGCCIPWLLCPSISVQLISCLLLLHIAVHVVGSSDAFTIAKSGQTFPPFWQAERKHGQALVISLFPVATTCFLSSSLTLLLVVGTIINSCTKGPGNNSTLVSSRTHSLTHSLPLSPCCIHFVVAGEAL